MADKQAFQISGLDGVLERLQALPKEVVQKNGGPVRKVLRNAAHIIRDEAKANVRKIIATPNIDGQNVSTGTLEKSIRTVKGRAHRTLNGERYMVLIPKRLRYPVSKRTPTGVAVSTVGRMLEYGTSRRDAMPWMRPAFHAKKSEAVNYVVSQLPKEIDKIVRKLARQGKR